MKSLLFACIVAASATALGADPPALARFEFSRVEMAVPVRIVLYAADAKAAKTAADAVFDCFARLNGVLSDYDAQSELRQLCETAGGGTAVPVSEDLWRVLSAAQGFSKASDGAFDATVGPIVRLWRRARRRGEMPPADLLRDARTLVDYRLVRLDPEHRAVELKRTGMRLDLGGIAKGYALDQGLAVLARHGIDRALIDAGGDIVLGGGPPDRPGWRIGVAPLDVDSGPSRYLWLSNTAVATSGDAWQFVQIGGRRYSHLVDPKTGLGLTDHSSVTVIAADGTTADALASAVSVLGPQKGIELVDRTPGAAALVVRAPEGKVQVFESKRWKEQKVDSGESN